MQMMMGLIPLHPPYPSVEEGERESEENGKGVKERLRLISSIVHFGVLAFRLKNLPKVAICLILSTYQCIIFIKTEQF